MHCLKLFSVGTFLKISALKTFRKKIYQPVEPAHYFKLITVKRVFGTVVYLVYKAYNNAVIEIIPAENTIKLRVYTDIINIFFRRILIKQRGVENGANKFSITNIFPKSMVQLPRVHHYHIARFELALFTVHTVKHGSLLQIRKFKIGMPVIDNRKRRIILLS